MTDLLRLVSARGGTRPATSVVCIEAGVRGWESIEFKELYASACEYLNPERVHKLVVDRETGYPAQVRRALRTCKPTHYVYDPRTGSQDWFRGLCEAFLVAISLRWHGVTPIVLLTDLSVRNWRAQSAVVSARSGVVVIFMSPRLVHPIFPHRRLVGPSLMPFSVKTLQSIDALQARRDNNAAPTAIFTGSLYEPRTTILKQVKEGLEARGQTFDVRGRILGSPRVPDADYWSGLCSASIVMTTANQMTQGGTDWTWISHLLYRYLEATACGALLVAPAVPGVDRYFVPGEDFVPFTTASDAVDVIHNYLVDARARERIASKGRERAKALVNARTFWVSIDVALGKDSFT